MTDIKNILLWSVSCYCLMDAASSYAAFYKNQITPDNIGRLTESTHIDTLTLFERSSSHTPVVSLPSPSNQEYKLASVCFITDAGNCDGAGAGFESSSSSGLGPIDPDNPEMCRLEGYVNTQCNSTQNYGKPCPYDSSWHTGCVCKSEYNQTCTSPMKGVGSSCNNKYKSCCNTCPEYTYTSIPKGYVSAGSCSSCDGPKYKVTEAPCTGYKRAGDCECGYDTTSSTCLSGSTTLYKSCKPCCSSAYVYNSSNCVYPKKLAGDECGGKYTKCEGNCADAGYLSSIPSGKICNKVNYAGKICYTSCRTDDRTDLAKRYCSGSQLMYEEYRKDGVYLGILVGNILVSNNVLYNTESECISACNYSTRGGLRWRSPKISEFPALRCAIVAMGGKTYDVYWAEGAAGYHNGSADWLFGVEDMSGPSHLYVDQSNYCACISEL